MEVKPNMVMNNDDDHNNDDEIPVMGNVKGIIDINTTLKLLRRERKRKEVETTMAKLFKLFCSLMSRSGSTVFCQNNVTFV